MPQQAPSNLVDEALGRRASIKMRAEGASYKEIAEAMGVSLQTAHNWVTAELEQAQKETAESVALIRELDAQRLDKLLQRWLPRAETNENALSAVLRILERRAKMYGVDAPTRTANLNMDASEINPKLLEAEARRMGIPLTDPKEVKALTCQTLSTPSSDESRSPEPSPKCEPEKDSSTISDTLLSTAFPSLAGSAKSQATGSGSSPRRMPPGLTGLLGLGAIQATPESPSGSPSPEDTTRPAASDELSTSSSDSPSDT